MRRVLTAAILVPLSVLVAACGVHHPNTADANNNGTYVVAGPMTYQLQVSRALNQYGSEDSGYLAGLPKRDAKLAPDQLWFGVFLWAKNRTKQPQQTTAAFDVVDTQGNVYHPVVYSNPYVWTSQTLKPGAIQPNPDTTAGFGPTQGQLLLFKFNTSVYSNRPLTLEIRGNTGKVWATISLDL
ncbi:MAG: hypothetical protein E6G05_09095 [Actinobacteria bacterium]|nr:MAG: hypothetical protein E6G05_09095 [Actinomycetota bacterium]